MKMKKILAQIEGGATDKRHSEIRHWTIIKIFNILLHPKPVLLDIWQIIQYST